MSCHASSLCCRVEKPWDALGGQDDKISKSARRKLRYRNAAIRKWSPCLEPPPGLISPWQRPVEELYDLVMSLSERLQRIELLLFTAPVEDFKVLDEHVNQMLGLPHKFDWLASDSGIGSGDSAASQSTAAEEHRGTNFFIGDSSDTDEMDETKSQNADMLERIALLERVYLWVDWASFQEPTDKRTSSTIEEDSDAWVCLENMCKHKVTPIQQFDVVRISTDGVSSYMPDIEDGLSLLQQRLNKDLLNQGLVAYARMICQATTAEHLVSETTRPNDMMATGLLEATNATLGESRQKRRKTKQKRQIGATSSAPACMTNMVDSGRARPVADGSSVPNSLAVGLAPEERQQKLQTFLEQIHGILKLAETLNGDVLAMLGRYRVKLQTAAGADIYVFDEAMALAIEDIKTAMGNRP